MNPKRTFKMIWLAVLFMMIVSACSSAAPSPTPTETPRPTATQTAIPTDTPRPTSTPRPSKTPNLAATQRMDDLNAEAQKYFDLGYLTTAEGRFFEEEDFNEEWAQLGWYSWWQLRQRARDFFISAHFKWTSAYRNADISGCGFAFAIQDDEDHYAVFLDRSKVLFLDTEYYYRTFGPTRGTDRVNFGNPFDQPVEADFTLIVSGTSAYVLVDDELLGEYTLSQSKNLRGNLGLTLLSGTNKDFGTRCEMTNIHYWIPSDG
jgi:hypothetical protein